MKRLRMILGLTAAVAAVAMAPGAEARAAFGVFDFNSTVVDPAGGTGALPAGGSLVFTGNTGTGINATLLGGADIVVGRVEYEAGDEPTTPTNYSVDFEFLVTLTDQDSGLSGDVTVTGTITGMYLGGTSPAINSSIIDYTVTPTSLDLGGTVYTDVSAASAGPGSVSDPGVLRINVSATAIPEPGSMALVGIGLVGLMGLRWRRRLQVA